MWSDSLGRAAIRSIQVLVVLALTACAIWGLRQIKLVVIPLLIACLIAAALAPAVSYLRKRRWPPALATGAVLLTTLSAIGAVFWWVGRAAANQWEDLVASAEKGFDQLQAFLTEGPLGLSGEQIQEFRRQAQALLTSEEVQSRALAGANVALEVVTGTILGIVVLFFFLKDGRQIFTFFIRPLPERYRQRAKRIGTSSLEVMGGYVRGTAIVALVDAVVIGAALLILGVPLALPLATVVFMGAFLPLIGATVAGGLAILVALVVNGPVTALIVLAVVVAVNQLEGDLLAPVVMGKALSLHPLAILLALTVGTILSGIVGALLSVPIAAVIWTAIKQWHEPEATAAQLDT